MDRPLLAAEELCARGEFGSDAPAAGEPPVLLVDLRSVVERSRDLDRLAHRVVGWPWIVVGVGPPATHDTELGQILDATFDSDDPRLGKFIENAATFPIAATTLALLLRSTASIDPAAALVAESTAYSTLQSGPEFARWRATRGASSRAPDSAPVVHVERQEGEVHVVLSRPQRHNAIDRRMRLELHDAMRAAASSGAVVVLRGDGPSFCSGGDLDEFGSFRDPADAHLVRMANHPAAALIDLGRDRIHAVVHGACLGGGLELAAFAGSITAHSGTYFQLPELGLGLIPGSGGTVSLPRRIGRQRTIELAVTMERIEVTTALAWGLVDEEEDPALLRKRSDSV